MSNYRASSRDSNRDYRRNDQGKDYRREDYRRKEEHGSADRRDDKADKDDFWNKRASDNSIQLEKFKTFQNAATTSNKSLSDEIRQKLACKNKYSQEDPAGNYSRKRSSDALDEKDWTHLYDKALPSSLLEKCIPENCGVCSVTLSSQVVSKAHYDGKNHDKKVRMELEKMFQNSSETPPKRKKIDGAAAANNFLKSLENDIITTTWDRALPQQLLGMCTSAKCELCVVDFTSESVGSSHYGGKNHDKKVQKWLTESFAENKSQMPQRVCAPMQVETFTDNKCSLCDVEISSSVMAKAHYSGRKHRSKVAANATSEKSGDFQNGSLYCAVCDLLCTSAVVYQSHLVGKQHAKKMASGAPEHNFNNSNSSDHNNISCGVCNIFVSSEDTLQSHKLGKAHRKKLQMMQFDETSFSCEVCGITVTDKACLDMHLQGAKHRAKVARAGQSLFQSIHGNSNQQQQATKGAPPQFSCSLCNVSSTDQASFNLHLESKKHKAKAGVVEGNQVAPAILPLMQV